MWEEKEEEMMMMRRGEADLEEEEEEEERWRRRLPLLLLPPLLLFPPPPPPPRQQQQQQQHRTTTATTPTTTTTTRPTSLPRPRTSAAALSSASGGGLHLTAPKGLAGVVAAARVLAVPSGAAAILQGLPGSIPWGVVMVFMVDYLHAQQGLSVQFAASIGLAWGVGGAPGVLGGGWFGQYLHDRVGPGAMPLAIGAAVALSTPPALFLVLGNVAAAPRSIVLILAFLGGMLASCSGPNCR